MQPDWTALHLIPWHQLMCNDFYMQVRWEAIDKWYVESRVYISGLSSLPSSNVRETTTPRTNWIWTIVQTTTQDILDLLPQHINLLQSVPKLCANKFHMLILGIYVLYTTVFFLGRCCWEENMPFINFLEAFVELQRCCIENSFRWGHITKHK